MRSRLAQLGWLKLLRAALGYILRYELGDFTARKGASFISLSLLELLQPIPLKSMEQQAGHST
jgi:hypothetical protein